MLIHLSSTYHPIYQLPVIRILAQILQQFLFCIESHFLSLKAKTWYFLPRLLYYYFTSFQAQTWYFLPRYVFFVPCPCVYYSNIVAARWEGVPPPCPCQTIYWHTHKHHSISTNSNKRDGGFWLLTVGKNEIKDAKMCVWYSTQFLNWI